ncbi:MAG: S46 family peptidase, partial [Chitinispirillales bacterium]|nr:S46 family peptidase [Chitinispirillales bacterium]
LDEKIRAASASLAQQSDSLARVYMAAQLLTDRQKIFYPDANQTLRVAFGAMQGYSPVDAVEYRPYTTLEGVMEKDNPDIYDYRSPQALKTAHKKNDFDRYAMWDENTVPVCFIASNHTSGGNSGSPVFNYKGELLGLNFDRNWEGTMSDVLYDPAQCRNIIVDIRYVLYIIDKVYGANRIVDEMNLGCGCE